MSLKEHVYVDHYLISKKIDEKVQNMTWKEVFKGNQQKNISIHLDFSYQFFFCCEGFIQNRWYWAQTKFDEDLGLLIIIKKLPIKFVDSIWFKRLALHACPRLIFLLEDNFHKRFCQSWWRN